MKSVRYGRYTGEDLGLSAEDLMRALSDFFLESGFNDPYFQFSEMNAKTLEDLKRALEQAIERGRGRVVGGGGLWWQAADGDAFGGAAGDVDR